MVYEDPKINDENKKNLNELIFIFNGVLNKFLKSRGVLKRDYTLLNNVDGLLKRVQSKSLNSIDDFRKLSNEYSKAVTDFLKKNKQLKLTKKERKEYIEKSICFYHL